MSQSSPALMVSLSNHEGAAPVHHANPCGSQLRYFG